MLTIKAVADNVSKIRGTANNNFSDCENDVHIVVTWQLQPHTFAHFKSKILNKTSLTSVRGLLNTDCETNSGAAIDQL